MITEKSRARSRFNVSPAIIQGFTLIELIILLAIVSILFRFGIPAFHDIMANNHMTTQINTMVTSFNLARSEAIKRNKNVVLCPNSEGSCAKQPHWHNGWLMFVDNNFDRELDDKEEEIIYIEAAKENIEIISSRYRRRVVFHPMGTSAGSNASYVFCDQRGPSKARAIILSNGGRARVAEKKSDGKEWKCS